jgi:hypothetical protein
MNENATERLKVALPPRVKRKIELNCVSRSDACVIGCGRAERLRIIE